MRQFVHIYKKIIKSIIIKEIIKLLERKDVVYLGKNKCRKGGKSNEKEWA